MGVVEREVVVTAREDTGSRPEVERADAFARLADRHLAASYRLAALLLGSEVEAQDAIQDAAVIGWERFADLRDPERFAGWFQRIVVNRCRDRLRQRRRIRVLSMDDALGVETPDGMARLAERDALRSVIDRLSPDQRTVLVLRYFADLTLEEIADRTGEPLGTVKSRLHYARQALHAAYDAAERLPGGTR